jgi:hypothetical protein
MRPWEFAFVLVALLAAFVVVGTIDYYAALGVSCFGW